MYRDGIMVQTQPYNQPTNWSIYNKPQAQVCVLGVPEQWNIKMEEKKYFGQIGHRCFDRFNEYGFFLKIYRIVLYICLDSSSSWIQCVCVCNVIAENHWINDSRDPMNEWTAHFFSFYIKTKQQWQRKNNENQW